MTALQNKANVLAEQPGRTEEAIRVLDSLLAIHPSYVPARAGRGVLLARVGHGARTRTLDAREALERDKTPFNTYQVAGIYALTSRQQPGDRREALRLLGLALSQGFGLDLIGTDHDLDAIRDEPEFRQLVEAARARRPAARPPSGKPNAGAQGWIAPIGRSALHRGESIPWRPEWCCSIWGSGASPRGERPTRLGGSLALADRRGSAGASPSRNQNEVSLDDRIASTSPDYYAFSTDGSFVMAKSRRLIWEQLESRLLRAAIGLPWGDPTHLTLSFAPDGTAIAGDSSVLFQDLDAQFPSPDGLAGRHRPRVPDLGRPVPIFRSAWWPTTVLRSASPA